MEWMLLLGAIILALAAWSLGYAESPRAAHQRVPHHTAALAGSFRRAENDLEDFLLRGAQSLHTDYGTLRSLR